MKIARKGDSVRNPITKEEIIEQGAKDWSDHDQGMSYEQAKKELSKIIPKLKRWKKSSKKAIIISGLVAGIVAFLVGLILSLNPLVSGIYSGYGTIFKSIDFFSRMLLNFVGSLLSMVLLAVLYSYTEKSINIKSSWKKGLFFGFLFWLVSRVPGSYSLWLSFNYPDILNIIQTFNGFIVNVISGVSLATIYKKLK